MAFWPDVRVSGCEFQIFGGIWGLDGMTGFGVV